MRRLSYAAGVSSRHRPVAAFAALSLLAVALALAGCGAAVQASGPGAARAASTPAQAASSTGDAWADAGQITPTPAPLTGDPWVTGPLPGTPEPQATTASTGDSYQAVNFTGPVESLPVTGWNGRWQVAGHTLNVTSSTSVTEQAGRIAKGAQVNVEGWQRADGSVDAGWITVISSAQNGGQAGEVPGPAGSSGSASAPATATPALSAQTGNTTTDGESEDNHNDNENQNDNNDQGQQNGSPAGDRGVHPIEMRGYVEALPTPGLVGDWRVSGRIVHVNAHTRLNQKLGAFADGAYVQLMGWQQPDGSINAAWIQVKKAPPGSGDNGDGSGNGRGNGNGNGKGNGKGKGGG